MPRNILFITTDQQHWNTLGVLNPEVKTPNLDRLAASGTLFERAYCPNPTCTPTRASIITGVHPSRHGAYSLGTKLPEDVPTVGAAMADAGVATALVGKAHFQQLVSTEEFPSLESYPTLQNLEFWRAFHGPFYGFDHVELARNHTDEAHVGQHYAIWMEENGFPEWRDHFRPPTGTQPAQKHSWSLPERYHYNAWITERSSALMEKFSAEDTPFFLWASYFDPHPSYLVPEPWASMYDPETVTVPHGVAGEHEKNPPHFGLTQTENPDFSRWQERDGNGLHGFQSHLVAPDEAKRNVATYYGMISMLDAYVGKLLDRLESLGLADETLVVFTSDHGHLFGQHGMTAKGTFHYEDLIRVPFITVHPDQSDAGRRSNAIQSLVDIAPSFLSFLGLPVPRFMTGRNQNDVWKGSVASVRDYALVENRHQPNRLYAKTYVDARYKITAYYGERWGELFDLESDPGEHRNLWDDPTMSEIKLGLLHRLLDAAADTEHVPMPRVAIA